MLDAARECAVLSMVSAGDHDALEELVLAHMPLVHRIVAGYRRRGDCREDLLGEGVLGVVEAARRFDLERGVRFATYAAWWVRAYVRRYALANRRIVGTPSTRVGRRLLARLPKAQHELSQRSGRPASRQELADELRVTAAEVASVEAALRGRDVSLDEPLSPEQVSCLPTPEQSLAHRQRRALLMAKLDAAMGRMTDREREIVKRRLLDEDRMPLSVLGRDLGISRERVRQLELKARAKLEHVLHDVA